METTFIFGINLLVAVPTTLRCIPTTLLIFVRNKLRLHVWLVFYIKKQAFLGLKNINFTPGILPSRQIRCLLRGWSMILVKFLNFFRFFFHAKDSSEKIFGDVLDRKQAFLDYKILIFPTCQIGYFLRG